MKTFIVLLVASAAMSFSGFASASDTSTAPSIHSTTTNSKAKVAPNRVTVRKVSTSKNTAVPTLSNKGWISVSQRSPAKTKIIQPRTLKTRTPVKFGK